MAQTYQLNVNPRSLFGKKTKQLRRLGVIPANIFGSNIDSTAIELPVISFEKLYKASGDTHVVNIKVNGETKTRPALVSQVHYNPVTNVIDHVDFRQVDLSQTINAQIPLEIVGESSAVSELGGMLINAIDEVEVEALPQDLPDKIIVDVSVLTELNQSLQVKDLPFDSTKVTMLTDLETVVMVVQEAQSQEEEVEAEPAETEVTEGETSASEATNQEQAEE
jgi:large subunit ribosomal protein L25